VTLVGVPVAPTLAGGSQHVSDVQGELDVYSPVARYWPEYAANGKAGVEVRHLLSHTSGVSGWQPPFSYEEIYDWDRSTSLLAA